MSEVKIANLGGSTYNVRLDGRLIGQVRPAPLSTASRPLWTAYRLNDDGYLGPLGGPWDHKTRREAVAHLIERAA